MKFWDNKGNIAVMAALSMPLIVGGAGLGVETGYWYYEQLRLQQAADAAAYAAALEHLAGDVGAMEPSAEAAATLNGFDPAADELEMVWPSADYSGDERTVDVELVRYLPRAFTALFNDSPIEVHAKATVRYEPQSNACLLALNSSANNAVEITGSAQMNIQGCVVSANSISNSSINMSGASTSSMPCITTSGGIVDNASVTLTECEEAVTGLPPAADPYEDLPLPTPAPCLNWNGNPATRSPGTYCPANGQVTIVGIETLLPGTYIFNNVSVNVTGGASLSGDDVTLIFLNGATITMNGNATINLNAPETGPYAGMLMMGDRDTTGLVQRFNGTQGSSMIGTIYFPADKVVYNGNVNGFNGCTQVVANTIEWSGNAHLEVDCSTEGMSVVQIGGRPYLIG